jgi:GNAT superfamily N-acetyltransferase
MFKIRLAEPRDVPALDLLIPSAVRSLSTGFYSARQVEFAIRYVFGPDTQLIQDQTYYVAVAGPTIIGCGGWSQRTTLFGGDQTKTAGDLPIEPGADPARIRAFFVDPRWVRRGVASAILRSCSDAAQRAGFRSLELVATLPGEPLYAAAGFRAVERYQLELPEGVGLPVVRMLKDLPDRAALTSVSTSDGDRD